ncbi:MAG: amidohydrolase family protein [Planctomycetes bacterium]|nr:amidohydrolase family protein [Planctomycetota bacterium]
MPFETPIGSENLLQPPVKRYGGSIIDAHTHVDSVDDAWLLFRAAQDYGVQVFCGVARPESIAPLRQAFGESFRPIVRIDHTHIGDPARFARENIRAIRDGRTQGAVGAKFWYAPRFVAEAGIHIDNPALSPLFETLTELGMTALIHIADPDCWFHTQYLDAARYRTKPRHYEPLERMLAAHPGLKVQGAHFGGDPEDLSHIARLLEQYPNFHIDTSATKWMARELSAKPDESRAFMVRWADRILFGSDLVAFNDATPAHYASRYWVQRWLWEGDGPRPSPIPDPCVTAPDGPKAHGLALPDDVLQRLYTHNARRVLGIEI